MSPLLATLLALLPTPFLQGDSPRQVRASAVVELLRGPADGAPAFLAEHVAPELVERVGEEALLASLATLHGALHGAELDGAMPAGPHSVLLVFLPPGEPGAELELRIGAQAPHAITDLWLEGVVSLDPAIEREPPPPPPGWETLAERMRAEEAAGFSGALLVLRDGEVFLDEGYGLANREAGIPVTPDTVFALGSTPIDFTRAAILLLWQDDVVAFDEPITAFFDDVPEDKRSITVEHLMSGASGLHDFHDLPGDADPDHSWIDRAEAIRRILSFDLLFEPGRGRQHSHSAWGLLAAIVEIRSGLSYQEFTRELLFEPAGMHGTGFNGDPVPEERLAIGYGERSDGEVNAPPYWGPCSWLVMGSGGMVGTTRDMLRWFRALRAGAILGEEALRRYWMPPGGLASAGDMYGFEIRYTEGPGSLFVLVSNSIDFANRRGFERLTRGIHALVR